MLMSLVMIILGLVVGLFINPSETLAKWIDRLIIVVIWLLIFMMGMSFGMKLELPMLKTIGFESLIYTSCTTLFSVMVVYFIVRLEPQRRKEKK